MNHLHIDATRNLDALFPGLEQILKESERAVETGCISPGQSVEMAEYVTQLRLTLAALKVATAREGYCQAYRFGDLETRFSALEGRIKELRNDLMP